MKVIFHQRFYEVYASDPAAAPGRMEPMVEELEKEFDTFDGAKPRFLNRGKKRRSVSTLSIPRASGRGVEWVEFVEPEPASEKDLERVHGRKHIQWVKGDPMVYEMGLLAAGGAILAGEMAFDGEPTFGLIRPPGHHASPHSCWGFCYFNNIAIAIKRLISKEKIRSALILDFDLHYGDGTSNIFHGSKEVSYFHPEGTNREIFLKDLQRCLQTENPYDIIAISAGFDRHKEDWGGLLTTEDYFTIGKWAKEASLEKCQGRRFGVLEGGYNHAVLGRNVKSFLQGLRD